MASNLIDKFLVIGYDQRNIENSLQNNKRQNLRNNIDDPLKFIEFNTRPTILNEICFNYNKELKNEDINKIKIYNSKEEKKESTNVICNWNSACPSERVILEDNKKEQKSL